MVKLKQLCLGLATVAAGSIQFGDARLRLGYRKSEGRSPREVYNETDGASSLPETQSVAASEEQAVTVCIAEIADRHEAVICCTDTRITTAITTATPHSYFPS